MSAPLAPIVVFGYHRPRHLQACLESLAANALAAQSTLYIYLDGPKPDASPELLERMAQTLAVAQSRQWCGQVEIIESPVNKGLAQSIEEGVTAVVQRHGRIIVLEDDLVLSPVFLQYMNAALALYADNPQVFHVSGYIFPLDIPLPDWFFLNSASCWGWATWDRAWQHYRTDLAAMKAELEARNLWGYFDLADIYGYQVAANLSRERRTWAVKWQASIILQGGYCLHPGQSLVNNYGMDETGEHCVETSAFYHPQLNAVYHAPTPVALEEYAPARPAVEAYFLRQHHKPGLRQRLKARLGPIGKYI
jgi:hypothetical protein